MMNEFSREETNEQIEHIRKNEKKKVVLDYKQLYCTVLFVLVSFQ